MLRCDFRHGSLLIPKSTLSWAPSHWTRCTQCQARALSCTEQNNSLFSLSYPPPTYFCSLPPFPPSQTSKYFIACLVAKSCPTLWDLTTCSPPGSSVHGIFQARKLEWVAISSSRGSSRPKDWTHVSCVSCTGRRILYHWATSQNRTISYTITTSEEVNSIITLYGPYSHVLNCLKNGPQNNFLSPIQDLMFMHYIFILCFHGLSPI